MNTRCNALVLVESADGRFRRFEGRTMTHEYLGKPGDNVSRYWVELIRSSPEAVDEYLAQENTT